MELLQYLINEEITFHQSTDLIENIGKRSKREDSDINFETLLSVLSESRVYIREIFNYCISCKCSEID
jgi:hypothetical protein